ncbi:unnamed protein product [Trichogramma brassicae]|uniref:Uncharacterized protein n=1 Tax=Trichogramma brassicae TaxID=86971 RepID=A0A6H5IDS3_9HYME|nr:unnamed protein product [Trichogramma brassicae]
MPRVAKILAFLLLASSLQASLTSAYIYYRYNPGLNPIFDLHSYENSSRVFAACDESSSSSQTWCLVSKIDDRGWERQCRFGLSTNRRGAVVQPGSMQVWRFGADRAILDWIDSSQPAGSQWRPMVVRFSDCTIYEADSRRLRGLEPVSLVVYDTRFVAVVNSDRRGEPACYAAPSRNRDVPRCWMSFDDRADITGGPQHWFHQAVRDNSMILVPIEAGTSRQGHLLIDTHQRQRSTVARVSILQRSGRIVPLHNYTVLDADSTDVDPYERIAYSTRNGYIGVCARTTDLSSPNQLTCHQWDQRGQMNLETSFVVKQHRHFHEFAVMNLPGYGGMLLLTADCQDVSCRDSNNFHYVSKIESDGSAGVSASKWFPKYECDRRINRADAQIYQRPGQYCVSQVCYEDFFVNDYKDPGQRRSREFRIDTECFDEEQLGGGGGPGRGGPGRHPNMDEEQQQTWWNQFFTQWYIQ